MFTGNDIGNIISGQQSQMNQAFQTSINLASFAEGKPQMQTSPPVSLPSLPVTMGNSPNQQLQFNTMSSRMGARMFGSAGAYSPMFSPGAVQEMVEREGQRRRETWVVGGMTNFAAPLAATAGEIAGGMALGSAMYQPALSAGLASNVGVRTAASLTGKQGLFSIASQFGAGTAARIAPRALAAGAVGLALPAAAMQIVYSGAEKIWEMHKQDRAAEDILSGSEWRLGNVDASGRGSRLAGGMRGFARETKKSTGMKMNVDDLMGMLQFGVDTGMFDMSRNFNELESKMTKAFEASISIAKALKTTVQGGMQMLGDLQQMGFHDVGAAAQQAFNVGGMARAAGMAPGQMMGMMGMGSQMARGMGLRGAAGAVAAGGAATTLRVGMQQGLVGRGTVGELGGIEGATQTILGAGAGFAQSGMGMAMMVGFGRGGGGFDVSALEDFTQGQIGIAGLTGRMGGITRADAIRLSSPLTQQRMAEKIMKRAPETMVAMAASLLEKIGEDVTTDSLAWAVEKLPGAQGMDANQIRALVEAGKAAPRARRVAAEESARGRIQANTAGRPRGVARGSAAWEGREMLKNVSAYAQLFEDYVGKPVLEGARDFANDLGGITRGAGRGLAGLAGYESQSADDSFGLLAGGKRMTQEQLSSTLGTEEFFSGKSVQLKLKEDMGEGGFFSFRKGITKFLQEDSEEAMQARVLIAKAAKTGEDISKPLSKLIQKGTRIGSLVSNRAAREYTKRDKAVELTQSLNFAAANAQRRWIEEDFKGSVGAAGLSKLGLGGSAGSEDLIARVSSMTSEEAYSAARMVGDTPLGGMLTASGNVLAKMESGKITDASTREAGVRKVVRGSLDSSTKDSPYEDVPGEGKVVPVDTVSARVLYVEKIEEGIFKKP